MQQYLNRTLISLLLQELWGRGYRSWSWGKGWERRSAVGEKTRYESATNRFPGIEAERLCIYCSSLIHSESTEVWKFSILCIDFVSFSDWKLQTWVVFSFDTGINKIHTSPVSTNAHFFSKTLSTFNTSWGFLRIFVSLCDRKSNKKKKKHWNKQFYGRK